MIDRSRILLAPLVLMSVAGGCRSGSLSRSAPANAEESAARQVDGAIPETVLGRELSVEELVGAPPAAGHDHHEHHGGHAMPATSAEPNAEVSDPPATHQEHGEPAPTPKPTHDHGDQH